MNPQDTTAPEPVTAPELEPEVTQDPSTAPAVVVDVTGKTSAPEATPKPSPDELRSLKNQMAGYQRIAQEMKQGLKEIREVLQKPQPSQPASPTPQPIAGGSEYDKYNAMVEQGRVWEAVRELSRIEAQQVVQTSKAVEALKTDQDRRESTSAKSKQLVFTKYPDLRPDAWSDENPAAILFEEVAVADPTLADNPHGPEIAMYRMEALAAARGIKLPASALPASTPPATPSRAPSVPSWPAPRGPASRPGTITLTREQKELCDHQGIAYEAYAKQVAALESNGSVEV